MHMETPLEMQAREPFLNRALAVPSQWFQFSISKSTF